MNIQPVSINCNMFNKIKRDNISEPDTLNSTELLTMNDLIGRSMVNFKGQQLSRFDKIFINNIASELKYSKDNTAKLTQTISDFLEKNKYRSLGDLAGDEFFDVQCDLIDKILAVCGCDNDDIHEYFVSEFSRCCDLGEKYTPKNFEDFIDEKTEFEQMFVKTTTALSKDNTVFYNTLCTNLGLDKQNSAKLKSIINNFLKKNDFVTLKALRNDDYINEQAELVSKISNEFNFSDNEEDILSMEIVNFIYSPTGKYLPITTPVDKDFDIFDAVCEKNGIDKSLRNGFFQKIKKLALDNNLSNIFEVFLIPNLKEDFLSTFPEDFIIDLAICTKPSAKNNIKIIKHKGRDTFYAELKDKIILKNLYDEFELSPHIFENEIKKRHPEYIEGGCSKNISQIAFELADKYNLPKGAIKKIVQIINEADSLDYPALDAFLINYLKDSGETSASQF